MKEKKIIILLIMINIITIGIIYNFIKVEYLNNKKIIVKAMTEAEYENYIKSLNASHEEYAKYVEESKKKIASAITDMGVNTSSEETLENMANNIKNIKSIDTSSMSTETHSGNINNQGLLYFTPTCPLNEIKIIKITGEYVNGVHELIYTAGVYLLQNGEIYETFVNSYSYCDIIDGTIRYRQTNTSYTVPVTCTIYY